MMVTGVKLIVRCDNTSSPSTPATKSAPTIFDNFTVGAIRRYIHLKFTDKQRLTLSTLAMELMTECIMPEQALQMAVWRLIHTMGFKYQVSQCGLYVRKESQDVGSRRIYTFKALQRYRNENTKVVYVDETWFTTRMGHSRKWVDTTQPVTTSTYCRQLPPEEEERFVVTAVAQ